jgi:uncharacterized protein (TIGR02678 family)
VTEYPQAAAERQAAARHLLANPLTCREHDEDIFRLIRRHEAELDRWFTQRLGYRLHLSSDTARLFKSGVVPTGRPLRTKDGRPLSHLEYLLLILATAATVAGPAVISLRDLLDLIRSAAAEVDVPLEFGGTERRALVACLRWMIHHGLASEMHSHVDAYAADETADAVLKMRPDRIALLAQSISSVDDGFVSRAERRENTRQWMRARLAEDPVLYKEDVTDAEWIELRRRLGEEVRYFDEMFGLVIEARAEGVAAIDPGGDLGYRPFPSSGTEGHAALLLVEVLRFSNRTSFSEADIVEETARLAEKFSRYWSRELVGSPERLARRAVDILFEARLAERDDGGVVRLLAGAGRFAPVVSQGALW